MQAVILAAGRGERMRSLTATKPLLPVLGMSMLERSMRVMQACHVSEVIIVTGHGHDAINNWHRQFTPFPGMETIRLVYNEEWDTTENGSSLLAAEPYIKGPFLLLMADHIYTPDLIKSLCSAALPSSGAVLATDGDLQRDDIDRDDVTYVKYSGDDITHIDKNLSQYNGFDTGAFLCSPDILDLMKEEREAGRTRISDVMQRMASEKRLKARRVDGMYWQDVDTPAMHANAEQGLLRWACTKPADGWVAQHLNRPISKRITRILTNTSIRPNHISVIAFGLGLLAACLLSMPHYVGLLAGGILVQLASIVDGCDGELARLRLTPSAYGGWFDAVLDRYADAAILAGLTWHVMVTQQSPGWMWLGMLAISGSFVSSYSAHKADSLLPRSPWRIGRDTRSLIIMLGAILAQPILTLWIIAITMNLAVVYRIHALRQTGKHRSDLA